METMVFEAVVGLAAGALGFCWFATTKEPLPVPSGQQEFVMELV